MKEQIIRDFETLETTEQIILLEALWDIVSQRPEDIPVTEAQKRELDRRLKLHKEHPDDVKTWDEVVEGIRS